MSRRRIVGTGVKVAYAAPVIAASFKLGSASVAAVSGECAATLCGDSTTCGGSTSCYCRAVDGTTICLQNRLCANPKSHSCSTSADCTDLPGGRCVSSDLNCCDDGISHCAYPCQTGTGAVGIADFSGAGEAVGSGVLGPVFLDD